MEGSNRAKAEKDYETARQQQEPEMFRRDIGNDAFDGVVALAECKQEVAIANGRVAAQSTNSNHALAGLWVQALTFQDQRNETGLDGIRAEIIQWDRSIEDESAFDRELADVYQGLLDIRAEYLQPVNCSG